MPNDPLAGGWSPSYGSAGPGGTQAVNVPGAGAGYGTTFATSATPYVPVEFSKNAHTMVPGTGPDVAGDYGDTEHNGLTGVPGGFLDASQQRTMQDALLFTLQQTQNDQQGTMVLQQQLIRAGYLNPKDRTFNYGTMTQTDATYSALAHVFNDAAVTGTDYRDILGEKSADPNNKLGLTYWEKFQQLTGQAPINKTIHSKTTQLSTVGDAYALAKSEYESQLGRRANTAEVNALHAALNAYEQAHPAETTKDVTIDPSLGYGGYQEKNVKTTGGVTSGDQQMIADQQIAQQHGKELSQTQGTEVYNLFAKLIGANF